MDTDLSLYLEEGQLQVSPWCLPIADGAFYMDCSLKFVCHLYPQGCWWRSHLPREGVTSLMLLPAGAPSTTLTLAVARLFLSDCTPMIRCF